MFFCMNMNTKVLYKLVVLFLLVTPKHARSTQNSKFVIPLQYFKKEGMDRIDFLHVDKHQTIHQVDTIILGTQNNEFAKSLHISRKK